MAQSPLSSDSSGQVDDLIVARSTAPGPAAVAVVRLDGSGVRELVDRLFRPIRGPGPCARPRRMVFGRWVSPLDGRILDEGLCVYFQAPQSYTGNDLAEFHCHGGPVSSRGLIEAALAEGARLAEPGEFTRRAFLNGRMDLAQAEAVADLINAQTERAARLAQGQLAGALSEKIQALRSDLIDLAAEIEARVDFPEEGIEEADRRRMLHSFERAGSLIAGLLDTRGRGRLLREGARVALVGAPNAGKSSLLNALVRMERAIVTPHPGTTRDTIECTIDLKGVPVTLIDTAGIRESADPVERIGVARSRREIEHADLVILVCDAAAPEGFDDASIRVRRPDITVLNKMDLLPQPPDNASSPTIPISAVRGDGLDRLEHALWMRLMHGDEGSEDAVAVNIRHGALLERAQASLASAREGFEHDLSGDLVMVDLREAVDAIGEILGLETGDAILDRIFSQFCLGKQRWTKPLGEVNRIKDVAAGVRSSLAFV